MASGAVGCRKSSGRGRSPAGSFSTPASRITRCPTNYTLPYEQRCTSLAGPRDLPHLDGLTGLLTGACGYFIPPYQSTSDDYSTAASMSYVTGSHAMKFGMTDSWGENSRTFAPAANINTLITLGATPFQVAVYNSPAKSIQNVNSDFGAYAQDTWTVKRVTLNYGGRFDHFNASVPAEAAAASTWIAARDFAEIKNVPNWNDWSVRLAAAYDVFGTGKTAIKANAGKYVASQAAGFAQTFNGMSGATQTVT